MRNCALEPETRHGSHKSARLDEPPTLRANEVVEQGLPTSEIGTKRICEAARRCPLSGAERKSHFKAARSPFDPKADIRPFFLIRSAAHNRNTLEDHADYRRRSRLEKSPKDTLVGTWVQVSLDTVAADGTRRPLYGENAKGMIIYTSNGYFTLMQASIDLPKLKSGLPSRATPEEAKAVIANSIAYFGKYSLDETSMVLSLDIQASTFANLTGNPSEKRNVTSLTDSELKFNRPFVKDVTLEAVFKRAE
ncbi:lipocalin-like domain-containing protein [Bradyrhizobium sp. KBS0727]|nr:lipocalin-like domain-containing protein [Bradyrhizobium sp. KBS0725]QDW43736.1 lipocalin-like domain-containing protein [Bradyrhizobium sp. KBS0727]